MLTGCKSGIMTLPREPDNPWIVPGPKPDTQMANIDGAWPNIRWPDWRRCISKTSITRSFQGRSLSERGADHRSAARPPQIRSHIVRCHYRFGCSIVRPSSLVSLAPLVILMSKETCYACQETLQGGARRCSICHAWQDWRRHVGQLTIMSILPIFVSVVALVIGVDSRVNTTDLQDRVGNLESKSYEIIYDRWKQANADFIRETGNPGQTFNPIDILWYQFFEHGAILLNASSDWSVALFPDKTWEKYENPISLVANYEPDKPSIAENIESIYQGPNYDEYLHLFQSYQITGGIGTLYVKYDLLQKLGKPLAFQEWTEEAAYVPGPVYDLLVGLVNTHLDSQQSRPKTVISLIHNGKQFKRDVVTMGESR